MIIPQSIVAASLFRTEVKHNNNKIKLSPPDLGLKINEIHQQSIWKIQPTEGQLFLKNQKESKYADDFAQQTGAEIKIFIYNPDNKKTQKYYTKNVSVPFGRESKHSTVEKSAAAPPLPPLVHSPFKGLNLPINFHNYLLSSSSGAASLPGASTITASSPKTSIKNPSSKDTSGKQNPSPTIDFQTHLPKPSSAVSSITTSPPTVNKIKHLPTSSSKSKAKSTKKSTKTVKTGKKYITKKDLKKKLKTLVSTSELIDKSYMKSRPKRTIKNE